ncbi:mechanosensitive ion channel [Candidatus Sulfidibacterium hydrothermale]|uniref:mechanosensitive ion channel domain-containing protein n=1 Tax=Candidatus Sulfidibacterium hydrothermale TaxID=2875962 RepID=UPI001F0A4C42|nr:mechanosensitive ion channel domain-containing protein [Candidatus Sulfidibacterium hydrothermale]UBM62744.1 mechanosensitive ion channel [Candidatus Sulfidibacterium hydrothermale]
MLKTDFYYRNLISFFLTVVILLPGSLSGQNQPAEKQAEKKEITINIANISQQSSEAISDIRQMKERLIQTSELQREKHVVDSLVTTLDKQIKAGKKLDKEASGTRKLRASLILLRQQKSIVSGKKEELNRLLNQLAENKNILSSNLDYWKKARTIIRKKKMGKTVENSANDVIFLLSETISSVNRLTNTVMGMIRKLSALELEIDARISSLDKILQKKQKEILSEKQPSFFALDFRNISKKSLETPLKQLYEVDLKNLGNYLSRHSGTVAFHIILIIVLIFVFIRLSKTELAVEKGEGASYIKRLKQLLSRPVSTALIVGIFASAIIYPNRPLIFRDLVILLIIIPIIILLQSIIKKRFHFFIYAFSAVLVAIIFYSYLPVSNVYSRILLLFISVVELLAALYFIMVFRKEKESRERFGKVLFFLSYGAALFIIAGLVANLIGKVMLAKYLLFSIAEMVLVFFIIMVTAVMFNGLGIAFVCSRGAQKSNFIKKNKSWLIKKIPRFINFVAALILIHYLLVIFGWETTISQALEQWLWHEYKIGSLAFSWGKLFVFLFIIWFSIFLARIVRDVLEEDILDRLKMEEGLPHTIAMMARYTLITIGFILAFSALGMPMSDLAIMFSAFGVGIGFGLQNIFNNLVSGFILLFERPIKIGDTIEVGDLIGKVRSIGIRASNIRTFDGAEIIIPNGNLISSEVINWTLSDQRRRIEIKIGVAYNSDPQKIKALMLGLLEGHPDVAKDPAPGIYFIEMGDSALIFRILFWTHQYGKWYSIRSNMMYEVFQTLKEAGIEIPYNQLDLHIRSSNEKGIHHKQQ